MSAGTESVVVAPEQKVPAPVILKALIGNNGFTVIVKIIGVPTQVIVPLVLVGVTVIVAIVGTVTTDAINAAISPVPLAARPMAGSLLVQL